MKEMPKIMELEGDLKAYVQEFDSFTVKVLVPETDLPKDLINYGFRAPYLVCFEETPCDLTQTVQYAGQSGLLKIASDFASHVVFLACPEEGWENAPKDLYVKLMAETRISQYYRDGVAIMWNRFSKTWEDYFIRGTVSRALLYGRGKAADYLAANYLRTVEGHGLFGPGDITPVCMTLENLSILPEIGRSDIPVVSIGNSGEVNALFEEKLQDVCVCGTADFEQEFTAFAGTFRRMVGHLKKERDYQAMGMKEVPGSITVSVSPDNRGDDKEKKVHEIGYVAYYNESLLKREAKVPLLLCFHGGGDSIAYMGETSGWPVVAHDHDFLAVLIENHLNSTATEMIAFLEELKKIYPIDEERIYASGFSMGGCKSWDMYQEYPTVFAGVAPMDATYEVGCNSYGEPAPTMNQTVPVPVFYVGGEETPLPELPFQAQKCTDRMAYVMRVNGCNTAYHVRYEDRENWEEKIFGIAGDRTVKLPDETRGSILTLHLFESGEKCCSIFGCVSGQGHEVRHHTCEMAWRFLSQFRRTADGSLTGGETEEIYGAF